LILNQWADAFVEQQTEYEQQVDEVIKETQSLAPEISFGRLPDISVASLDVHPAIEFGHGENRVNLRGRIDRVDVGSFDGHPAYVVIDYKTGQRPSLKNDDLISGRSIQLALYLLAVKRLGLVTPDAVPYQMGFWTLRDTGFKPGMGRSKFEPIDAKVIQALEILLDDLLPRLAEGIRSGSFIVENNDPHCTGRCLYCTVCRVNQLRPLAELLGKRSPPPGDPTADEETGEGRFSSRTKSGKTNGV
jgi:ATP-dependent helicase/nuclease subunit B